MPFPSSIQKALGTYDSSKGLARRYVNGDHPSIANLKTLPEENRSNVFEMLKCFKGYIPDSYPWQAHDYVREAILTSVNLFPSNAVARKFDVLLEHGFLTQMIFDFICQHCFIDDL